MTSKNTNYGNPYRVVPKLSKSLPPSSNLSPRTKKLHEFDLSQSNNNDKRYSDIAQRKGDNHNFNNYLDEIMIKKACKVKQIIQKLQ